MSIGLTRLFYILNEFEYLNRSLATSADVLMIPMTDDMTAAVEISAKLREAGISTQIYFEKKKFKHKIGYADKLAIPYAIFLGEDEIRDNQVTLKKMFAAEDDAEKQVTVSVEEAIARSRGGLGGSKKRQNVSGFRSKFDFGIDNAIANGVTYYTLQARAL